MRLEIFNKYDHLHMIHAIITLICIYPSYSAVQFYFAQDITKIVFARSVMPWPRAGRVPVRGLGRERNG
jgi:hypothetical protein